MGKILDKISPSLFILAILCFALPFVDISCAGQSETLSGLNLVTGFSAAGKEVDPNPLAIAAVAAALLGAILFFLKNTAGRIIQSVLGILGIAALVALKILLTQAVEEKGFKAEWLMGFYICLASFLGAVVCSVCTIFVQKEPLPQAAGYNSGPYDNGPVYDSGPGNLCPSCNRFNEMGDNWCQWCGSKLQQIPAAEPINRFEQEWPAQHLGSNSVPIRPSFAEPPLPDAAASILSAGGSANTVAESVTMPLQADSVPLTNQQPVPFLRTQRVGRWELIPILKNEFIIGSDPARTDYQENSGNLGQIHAIIEKLDGNCKISNTQADCEIFINDQRLTVNMFSLYPGDVIRLNNVIYIFDVA